MTAVIDRRRRLVWGAAVFATTVAALTAAVLAADLWAHHRAARTAGVNVRGYRGPLVGRHQPGEWRIAMLGGSTVFGYGVLESESLPAQLEQVLAERGVGATVVNLGFNSEGAYAFETTIRDYAALRPDLVVLYEGYNDLLPELPNTRLARHGSLLFRLTGYFPMLPMVLRDKADAMTAGDARAKRVVFGAAANTVAALEEQIGRLTNRPPPFEGSTSRWSFYCDAVTAGVRAARDQGAAVLVVTQPYISDVHIAQQEALRGCLQPLLSDARVAYFDAGRVIDLHQVRYAFDGMHLTPQGNRRMAEALMPAVQRLK